jgi:hypothetical protein
MGDVDSRYQTPKRAKVNATKAPKIGEKLKVRAIAIPGSATWESASPTRAILLRTIKDPR